MNDEGEWTDWIEHDGMGCPVLGMFVHIKHEGWCDAFKIAGSSFDGTEGIFGSSWHWAIVPNQRWARVIRYRVRKPRALLDLIDLVENLPAPVTPERVDA